MEIRSTPRRLLFPPWILFAAATTLYSAIWMYYIRRQPAADLGIQYEYRPPAAAIRVTEVAQGGPAEQAGLQVNDRIRAVNGRTLVDLNPLFDIVTRGRPGDIVRLAVERSGLEAPHEFQVKLRRSNVAAARTSTQVVLLEFVESYPILFLLVGTVVLFLRIEDRNAWLLAVLFAGFIAGAPLLFMEGIIHPALRGFTLAYMVTFYGMTPAVFYYFFAVFPVSSPLDRRVPWLKNVLLASAGLAAVGLGTWTLLAGSSRPLHILSGRLGGVLFGPVLVVYGYGPFALGLTSLFWNSFRASSAEARRKSRVIVWGTASALTPFLLLELGLTLAPILRSLSLLALTPTMLMSAGASTPQVRSIYQLPFWVWVPTVLATFLFPISFAYAVVKHRVLEIPVLLKRSARYLLVQRGFVLLSFMIGVAAILLSTALFTRVFRSHVEIAVGAGVVFGVLWLFASLQVHQRVTRRIDRAFFRSAYDARQILEDLSEKTRTTTERGSLATLLETQIRQALHPTSLAVFLEGNEGRLSVPGASGAGGTNRPASLAPTLPWLEELARQGRSREAPPPERDTHEVRAALAPLEPECLVPILGRNGRLVGLVVLGQRLSEESYSRDDLRLLASVASQAGIALESIRLAGQMAERLEAERRAAHEMEIAKQVQARLFPQKLPPLSTLEYAGGCTQARQVGGDYYDFLDLGPGRVGLALADISGKGISGALLMANLQANLRSQYAVALNDLPRLLESVNRLFFESTPSNQFASFFFGDYNDITRRISYANCGHNPPLLLRADGTAERLKATATVLGMFEEWKPSIEAVELRPGDLLVIYSDGVTEARDAGREEFGEKRLLETLRALRALPPRALLEAVVARVQEFSAGEQEDDITLVVARAG